MTTESDRELDQLLADTAAVRQRLRAESAAEVPPPHVDAAILAAARRAVHARPTLVGRSPWRRWQVPLAAAAVLVVATSLSLVVDRGSEPGLPIQPHAEGPASAPDVLAEYRALPGTSEEVTAAKRAEARARVQEPARKDSDRGRPAKDEAAPVDLERASKSEPLADRLESPTSTVPEAPPVAEAKEAKPEIQNQALAPPPAAPEPAPPASAKQELRQARESAAPMEHDVAAAGSAESGVPPAPAVSAASKAAAPAALAKRRMKLDSEEVLRFAEQEPDRVLATIRQEWEAGHQETARRMLAEFLRKQPGYPLPPDYPVPRPTAEQLKEGPPEGR